MSIKHSFSLLACLLCTLWLCAFAPLPTAVMAQNDYEAKIVVDELRPDYDTLDYGYVWMGDSVNKAITIYNIGKKKIGIPIATSDFIRKSLPLGYKKDDDYEFPITPDVVFTLDAGKKYSMIIPFQPDLFIDENVRPPGKKAALLRLRIVGEFPDTNKVAVLDSVFLKAVKCDKPFWSDDKIVDFDSVYVNPVQVKGREWIVRNVRTDSLVTVDTMSVNTAKRHPDVFNFTTLPLSYVNEPKPKTISISYKPDTLGEDAITYHFVHYNPRKQNSSTKTDSLSVLLRGVGVEQRFALSCPRPTVRILGDTVDLGYVWQGTRDTFNIIVQNKGNIPFNKTGVTSLTNYTPDASASFTVLKDISTSSRHMRTNEFDTLRIVYFARQQQSTPELLRCALPSDLATRVFGVPVGADTFAFYLRAASSKPELSSSTQVVDFGSIAVYDLCPPKDTFHLVLRNLGRFRSVVDSVRIEPAGRTFSTTRNSFFVEPLSSDTVDLIFAPEQVGDTSARVLIYTKENVQPYSFRLRGRGVAPQPLRISLPKDLRFFPGHKIAIPILTNKELITVGSRFSASIAFDSSLIQYATFIKSGTASVVANDINVQESVRGRIDCDISVSNRNFSESDTLLLLVFDTFLGYDEKTDLTFETIPSFGNVRCPKALPVAETAGSVRIDSVCGLQYKIMKPARWLRMLQLLPNPAVQEVEIQSQSSDDMEAQLRIYNAMGSLIEERSLRIAKGEAVTRISVAEMPEGFYMVELQAGLSRGVQGLVIAR